MNMNGAGTTLPDWQDQMAALTPLGERLLRKWGRGDTDAERQGLFKLALSALANGYLCHVDMDPARPRWAPLWNRAMNLAGPAPDYVYKTAEIDPAGIYRISGFRGTTRFTEITQQRWLMIGGEQVQGTSPGSGDLDSLTLDPDGAFSVILSATRPESHEGDWWRLEPGVIRLLMRACACDWRNEIDARIAIERLDPADSGGPEDIAQRIANMAAWVENVIGFDIDLARYYREQHGINVLTRSKIIDTMSGLPEQIYYDGAYEIDDDEALVISTDLPQNCRYWSILVADDRFSTVDWHDRQSSLNDVQARIDADGRFRAVVSARDPGIHNWLDKGDNGWGILQLRWNRASDAPDPQVVKVPIAEIARHLPPETPTVTPAERHELLRLRREGAQFRGLW